MNTQLLKSYCVKMGDKQSDMAAVLGIANTTLSCKMTGKRKFTLDEARILVNHYKIPDEDAVFIFLK